MSFLTFSSSSSDEVADDFYVSAITEAAQIILEEEQNEKVPLPRTRRAALNRDRKAAHELLVADYFAEDTVFTDDMFRRRFRMSRRLFLRIADDLARHDPFFTLRYDGRGKRGFTTLQKCTAAIRQLGYGTCADSWEEYLKMSERTIRECLYKFCKRVIKIYSKQYLRKPTRKDIEKLYAEHEQRHGFPGILGSIDCTHWQWRNCPNAWRGPFMRGDHGYPSLMLEAVASRDLWVWHAFFGVAGSNNDLNVLHQSEVFNDIIEGIGPDSSFMVSGVEYKHGYYLADRIYPEYAAIVKTLPFPEDDKRKKFAKCQESARKDVERLFGVLKQQFHIVRNPARAFTEKNMRRIMYACILLHNMILEDEGHAICEYDPNDIHENVVPVDEAQQESNMWTLHNPATHHHLRADLIEHIWQFGRVNPDE